MHFYSECGMQSLGAATSKLAFKKVFGLGDCLVVRGRCTDSARKIQYLGGSMESCLGQQGGSSGRVTCCGVSEAEFDPWDPHDSQRELTSTVVLTQIRAHWTDVKPKDNKKVSGR